MADREDERNRPGEVDPDAPPTAEEVAASQRLRDALETPGAAEGVPPDVARDVELAESLRAAWSPEEISSADHRAIVDATPTADELASAEALRAILEAPGSVESAVSEGRAGSSQALLAIALRAAYAPAEIGAADHAALVDAAVARMPAKAGKVVDLAARRRGNVVRVTFGVVTGAIALAASVMLVLGWQGSQGSQGEGGGVALAKVRTTQPLFTEPFKTGETSARIDRIASARASDLRDNRFAKWGVR